MTQRFVENTGTISITSGTATITGTGTLFAGRDRAGAQVWALPAGQAPIRVGVVAEVDPRGIYENLSLPLVSNFNGSTLTNVAFELVDGLALASGATQAAIFARYAAFLEQNAGLVLNTDDEFDYSLVPNNSLIIDPIAGMYQWRDGVLVPVSARTRQQVRAATTANITIATALNDGDTLDGVTLATGDLVLVKDQSTKSQNGIYEVGVTPARHVSFDTWADLIGLEVSVVVGTANANTLWISSVNPGGTLGTDNVVFSKIVYTAGAPVDSPGFTGTFALQTDITPSSITSDQNNYAPTGHGTASVLRLTSDAPRQITGLQGGADGRIVILENVNTTANRAIVLKNEDAGSTAAYRFALGGKNYNIAPGRSVILIYDSGSSRWRPLTPWSRLVLTGNLTVYVRTDGNDANSGMVDSAVGAFLTVQAAINWLSDNIDSHRNFVTIQIRDGAFSAAGILLRDVYGMNGTAVIMQGNATTPANVVLEATSGGAVVTANAIGASWSLSNFRVQSTALSACHGIRSMNRAQVFFTGIDFGALGASSAHLFAGDGGKLDATGNYTCSGNAAWFFKAEWGGLIKTASRTITFAGSQAFTTFAAADWLGMMYLIGMTFTNAGSVTGARYAVTANAMIQVNGAGASYLPGNSAGSVVSGGLYV